MLQVGDILMVRGNSWFSPIVRKFLRSDFTHVAICIDNNFICEIDAFSNLSFKRNYHTDYDVLRYKKGLTRKQQKRLKRFLAKKVLECEGYDWSKIAELFLKITFKLGVMMDQRNRYICSEIVDAAFQELGIDLLEGFETGDVAPTDFLYSQHLIKVGQVKPAA